MTKKIFKHRLIYTLLTLVFAFGYIQAQTTSSSVLATGDWYKIKVGETGVYKLTYEDLKKIGISEPKNAKIYGYGGWMLDQDFSTNTHADDLPPVAVWMSKPQASFGPGDFILFYAKGTVKWTYNRITGDFEQTQNPYSKEAYYFVTESSDAPFLIADAALEAAGSTMVDTYIDYYLHEKELKNVTESGRKFYGESFLSKNSQDFAVSLPGISTAATPSIAIDFIARAGGSGGGLSLSINNDIVMNNVKIDPTIAYYEKAKNYETRLLSTSFKDNNSINIKYQPGSSLDKNVHLNYFRINYARVLKPYGAVTLFRSKLLSSRLKYSISDASDNLLVFDVTNGEIPKKMPTSLSGTTMTFTGTNVQIKEYALVDISKAIPAPTLVEKVKNQNLHALETKEMVIIVRPYLRKYAEQLAQIHLENSGLECLIVEAEDIYNEFSSGKPDVTAYRRFLKMLYDRGTTDANRPQYLLLFGDATYDNRFIQEKWSDTYKKAILLSYQSESSLHEEKSYIADDYVGFLGNENVTEESIKNSKLNIGIGRFPVRTEAEAVDVLNKIKRYLADNEIGLWKNNIGFVADDLIAGQMSEPSQEVVHLEYTDKYTVTLQAQYPELISNKIYADAYERQSTSSGERYPQVNQLIKDKINSGLLLLNYVGHGSTLNWSHENLLLNKDIEELTNTRLPLVITATCDFGRYDGDNNSGGEIFLLNPKGGAIALFTTSRVVYGSDNHKLNTAMFKHLFEKKEDGQSIRLGDVIRYAKTDPALNGNDNKLRFALLGDPALRLSYPSSNYKVEVKEVNGVPATEAGIQLKAMSRTVIKGQITNDQGGIATDFNGVLESVVFDNVETLKTRGQNWNKVIAVDFQREYKDYTSKVYSGIVDVTNGEFVIEVNVPKDILYTTSQGKMSFYAYDKDDKTKQAKGSFLNYNVGGVDDSVLEDDVAPTISKMYLNREDFQSGELVNNTPTFYAEVSDNIAINTSGGVGHNISLLIDGVVSYDLTPYFVSDAGSNASGKIKFTFPTAIKDGKHTLQFKVWDISNNSATSSFEFYVQSDYKPVLYDFRIEGNPAKDRTVFKFISDVSGSKVDVKYQVYSMEGALLWTKDILGTTAADYDWDLITSGGARLGAGIYICRMNVSVGGGSKASKSKKLIVLEQ